MRKISFRPILVIVMFAFILGSCQDEEPKPAELISISIKTAPTKIDYYENEVLDLSGLIVKFNMDNGETEDIAFLDFTSKGIVCSPENGAILTTESTIVTITDTKTSIGVNQTIMVTDIVVNSITIKTAPSEVDYCEGEVLNLSGLVVSLTKNNGETEDIAFSDFTSNGITCSPENGSKLSVSSTLVTITHSVSGKNINQSISVFEMEVLIKTAPTKVEYYEGDNLDLSGLVVSLSMSNGTTEDVLFTDFASKGITCSPENGLELTMAQTEVTISHTVSGKNVNQLITVNEVVVIDLLIKTEPTKLDYYIGETLDLSGLVVTLSMNNGTDENVSISSFASQGITCSPENGSRLSTTTSEVTIEHTETGVSEIQAISFLTLTDIDGNTYEHIKIGEQLWMAENLKTTTYNDGTPITLETNNDNWKDLSTEAYSWFNNDEINFGDTYGALYNWYAVNTENICPEGWHVPEIAEWRQLIDFLSTDGHSGTEGKALKATNSWHNDGNGTDDYGFKALPSGYRTGNDGAFYNIGGNGFWWNSNEQDTNFALIHYVSWYESTVSEAQYEKNVGFSVRCIKD